MIKNSIRIVWLSNRIIDSKPDTRSGTWLKPLALELVKKKEIELCNISFGKVRIITPCDYSDIKQWQIPDHKSGKFPSKKIIQSVLDVIDSFRPDVIQIWGVEKFWGRLLVAGRLNAPVLINIQGVMRSIVPTYSGGLNCFEQIGCFGLRELVYPRDSIIGRTLMFKRLSVIEREILKAASYISIQSKWTFAQVSDINRDAMYFHTERALRHQFYNAEAWKKPMNIDKPTIFCSSIGNPYKGFHVVLRALREIKKRYPSVSLRVAGGKLIKSWKSSGYDKFLLRMIDSYQLSSNIVWLGFVNAYQLVDELRNSHCFIHSSFVESYSLSLAEALAVGTPCISSFAGALPEMSFNHRSVLYYPPGDSSTLAYKVMEVIENLDMAESMSQQSRSFIRSKCNLDDVVNNQINIYREIKDKDI